MLLIVARSAVIERREAGAEELDELADDALLVQHLRHGETRSVEVTPRAAVLTDGSRSL